MNDLHRDADKIGNGKTFNPLPISNHAVSKAVLEGKGWASFKKLKDNAGNSLKFRFPNVLTDYMEKRGLTRCLIIYKGEFQWEIELNKERGVLFQFKANMAVIGASACGFDASQVDQFAATNALFSLSENTVSVKLLEEPKFFYDEEEEAVVPPVKFVQPSQTVSLSSPEERCKSVLREIAALEESTSYRLRKVKVGERERWEWRAPSISLDEENVQQ